MSNGGKILIISSYVVSGQVGLQAALPALRALNIETLSLPTTLLAAHPAAFPTAGPPAGEAIPVENMRALADWLLAAGALDDCTAIISGYMPSAEHCAATAKIVQKIKQRKPDVIYCCDPICGDHGKLYLPESVVRGLRDCLLPLADMATPNLFEAQILSGTSLDDPTELSIEAGIKASIDMARALTPPHIIITSAPATSGRIATLSVASDIYRCETARAPEAPHGTGDLFTALYLGLYLNGEAHALGIACASLANMVARNPDQKQLPHRPVSLAPPALSDKIVL